MNGLAEIRAMNNRTPPKPMEDPRVQRDRLAQCVRRLLTKEPGAEDAARAVLVKIFGK